VGGSSVAVGCHGWLVACGAGASDRDVVGFAFGSPSDLWLALRSSAERAVCSGVLVRLITASCSSTRRRVVSVVVDVLRVCDDCDALPSSVAFRNRSVAALVGRFCCWRSAAEARRSAIEAAREGGFDAILWPSHRQYCVVDLVVTVYSSTIFLVCFEHSIANGDRGADAPKTPFRVRGFGPRDRRRAAPELDDSCSAWCK